MKRENLSIIFLSTMILIEIIVLINLIGCYKEKSEYCEYYDKYVRISRELDEKLVRVEDTKSDIAHYENGLLESITEFYETSEDEAFRKVFEDRILDKDNFRTNEEYLAEVYAFLNAYPKMMMDKEVNANYISVACSKKDLQDEIYEYNVLVEEYLNIITAINESKYVTRWDEDKIVVAEHSFIVNLE